MYKIVPSYKLAELLDTMNEMVTVMLREARDRSTVLDFLERVDHLLVEWDAIDERSSKTERAIGDLINAADEASNLLHNLAEVLGARIPEAETICELMDVLNEVYPKDREGQDEKA